MIQSQINRIIGHSIYFRQNYARICICQVKNYNISAKRLPSSNVTRSASITALPRQNTTGFISDFENVLYQTNYEVLNKRYTSTSTVHQDKNSKKVPKTMTNKEWKDKLTPDEYYVSREAGTEPPFSGKYYDHHEIGMYQCICCGADLFSSLNKYDSGCGWPSFHTAEGEDGNNVTCHTDNSQGMKRIECLCKVCEAHLGHVFDDGPPPTGKRYCINSLSLAFKTTT